MPRSFRRGRGSFKERIMPIQITDSLMKAVFPKAPKDIRDAFVQKQHVLESAGINKTPTRLAYFFANIYAETGGFSIRNLEENINYTASRMAEVWPNRFSSASAVRSKYGSGPGWLKKAFNDIYGSRMGNRPGTNDGSDFIGRGGPQITGRDGYKNISDRIGVDLVSEPELATKPELQPEIAAAFWCWKNMQKYADREDFVGCVKAWNGGTNGLDDRTGQLRRLLPLFKSAEATPPGNEDSMSVETAQERLKAMNYNVGTIDGLWGSATAGGISAFLTERESNLPAPTTKSQYDAIVDQLDLEMDKAELEGWKRKVSAERKSGDITVVKEIAPEVVPAQRNWITALWATIVTFLGAIFTAISEYVQWGFSVINDHRDQLDSGFLKTVWGYIQVIPLSAWIAIIGCVFAFIAINALLGVMKIKHAVKTGERL